MAEEKKESTSDTVTTTTDAGNGKKKRKGFLSRIWNVIFRSNKDDLEKRLQYISKEEASVLSRISKRSRSWRKTSRNMIIFSVLFEVIAVCYAIMTTRSVDMNWKMRAIRVLPMFLLPALSSAAYSTFVSFIKMFDTLANSCFIIVITNFLFDILLVTLYMTQFNGAFFVTFGSNLSAHFLDWRDQKNLEKLRAERQAKIDELKEKTNYYITQQLIQRYDTDPAAKAAAASVLASKLGADSGLKVYLADESKPIAPTGKTNDSEPVQSSGIRNRKQVRTKATRPGTNTPNHPDQQLVSSGGVDQTQTSVQNQHVVVEHHQPQSSTKHGGGWVARIAALLVGEDPTQSYALICGNCYMHNGLARKEEFPFITYYCPHCHALNKPKQSGELISSSNMSNTGSPKTDDGEAVKNASVRASDSLIRSPKIEEVSEGASLGKES